MNKDVSIDELSDGIPVSDEYEDQVYASDILMALAYKMRVFESDGSFNSKLDSLYHFVMHLRNFLDQKLIEEEFLDHTMNFLYDYTAAEKAEREKQKT